MFQHALAWLAPEWAPEIIVHLRPTSPARRRGLIDQAVGQLTNHADADSLRSVSPARDTPYKMWRSADGWLEPLLGTFADEFYNRPRQTLPTVWRHDGVIDVIRRSTISRGSMTGHRILAFELDAQEAADLDIPQDLSDTISALKYVGLI